MYGIYFQAHVPPAHCFLVIGILKSYEHIVFTRTLFIDKSILEFFTTPETVATFLSVMNIFEKHAMVFDLKEMPNRLMHKSI
jgi:hypothetical protein